MERLSIAPGLELPLNELEFSFARSGGPGGQHVNRAETKVELRWDISGSPSLSPRQRELLLEHLASYTTNEGVLILTSGESRSQHRNREAVIGRLQILARNALRPRRSRRPTRPTAASETRRRERKRRHSEKKARRGKVNPQDY